MFILNCQQLFPTNTYLFNINNRNTRRMSELCSKLTVKAVVDVIDQLKYTCSKSRMEIVKSVQS